MKSDNDGLVFCGRIIFVVLIRSPRHDPLYDIALCVPWTWTHLCLISGIWQINFFCMSIVTPN
jgi:hypothetical protein